MPALNAKIENMIEAIIYPIAAMDAPRSHSVMTSNEKVEKVVNPPRTPTVKKARTS